MGRRILLPLLLVFFGFKAHGFDQEPYVLTMPGHTATAEWSDAANRVLITCDYKNLQGVAPRLGEPCDGSPRLSFDLNDLRDLRYVTQARDNQELIDRIYERFPNILFVISPDFVHPTAGWEEPREVNGMRSGVDRSEYDRLASLVENGLYRAADGPWPERYAYGVVLSPYAKSPNLGYNPLSATPRPLQEYSIVILPKNIGRATVVHELLHHMIHRARERAIANPQRLRGLYEDVAARPYWGDTLSAGDRKYAHLDPRALTSIDRAKHALLRQRAEISAQDLSIAEELEIAYFIGLYGAEMGLSSSHIRNHEYTFWFYVIDYVDHMKIMDVHSTRSVPHAATVITKAPEHGGNAATYEEEWNWFWEDTVFLAQAYPRNLLGSEDQVGARYPMTMINRFVTDVGPRAQTAASR